MRRRTRGCRGSRRANWLPRWRSTKGRADPAKIATTVAGGKLGGVKAFVAEGDSAQLFVVAATDGLYLVSGDAGRDAVAASPDRRAQPCPGDVRQCPAEALSGGAELIAPCRGPGGGGECGGDARHG